MGRAGQALGSSYCRWSLIANPTATSASLLGKRQRRAWAIAHLPRSSLPVDDGSVVFGGALLDQLAGS